MNVGASNSQEFHRLTLSACYLIFPRCETVGMKVRKYGALTLMISVLTTNAPARRFYEAIGGQMIGTRETEDYGFPKPQVVYGWENVQSLLVVQG